MCRWFYDANFLPLPVLLTLKDGHRKESVAAHHRRRPSAGFTECVEARSKDKSRSGRTPCRTLPRGQIHHTPYPATAEATRGVWISIAAGYVGYCTWTSTCQLPHAFELLMLSTTPLYGHVSEVVHPTVNLVSKRSFVCMGYTAAWQWMSMLLRWKEGWLLYRIESERCRRLGVLRRGGGRGC